MGSIKRILIFIKENKLISGSFVMVLGSFLGSITGYLFHLIVARSLGPKDYGILDSLISLMYQLSIPLATISLVIVKYVSSFKGQGRSKIISSFFWKINKKILFLLPVALIVMVLLTPLITNFLHLPSSSLFIVIFLSFLLGIFITVEKSFFQGLILFEKLTFIGILEGLLRLVLAVFLLSLGWGLMGAVFPFFLAGVFSFCLSSLFLKTLWQGKRTEPITEKKEMLSFIFPAFFTNLGITLLITSDIILARHFLSAEQAGFYSALSTLGKIVFFTASPVTGVVFPMVSEAHAGKKRINHIVLLGLLIIGLITIGCLFVFGFFPKLMILSLFGEKYLVLVPYLFSFALGVAFYSIDVTLLNIFLARKIIFPSVLVCLAAILQIILIFFFHGSLLEIVKIFIFVSALLLTVLLLYYWRNEKH